MSSVSAESVNQAVLLLQALRDPTCHAHQAAMTALSSQSANTEFIFSMLHVFSKGFDVTNPGNILPIETRQLSGYVIKNYIIKNILSFNFKWKLFMHCVILN